MASQDEAEQDGESGGTVRQADQEPTDTEICWDTWLDLAQLRDEHPGRVTAQQVWAARDHWEEAAAAERREQAEAEAG